MKKEEIEMAKGATCEQWEELWAHFANPKCSKCYGRGYTGWSNPKSDNRKPIACNAKGCALRNLKKYRLKMKLQEMEEKKKKAEEKEESDE